MQNDSAAVHDRRNSVATLNAPELTGHVKFSSLLTTSDFCSPVKSFSETLWSRILEVRSQFGFLPKVLRYELYSSFCRDNGICRRTFQRVLQAANFPNLVLYNRIY